MAFHLSYIKIIMSRATLKLAFSTVWGVKEVRKDSTTPFLLVVFLFGAV